MGFKGVKIIQVCFRDGGFASHIGLIVGFVVHWLIYNFNKMLRGLNPHAIVVAVFFFFFLFFFVFVFLTSGDGDAYFTAIQAPYKKESIL